MRTFLLINDDPEHIRRWTKWLQGRLPNVFVVQCTTTTEALEAIARVNPTDLLLDIQLTPNGQEGLEIARAVRTTNPLTRLYSTSAISEFLHKELAELNMGVIDLLDVEKTVREMVKEESSAPVPTAE